MSTPAKLIPDPAPRRPPPRWLSGPLIVLGVLEGVVQSLGAMVGAILELVWAIFRPILVVAAIVAAVVLGLYAFLVLIKALWKIA